MNALVPLAGNALPAAFASFSGPDMTAAAQANLQASFGVIGYKGKNWRIKYRGEEILVKDSRGLPEAALEVVIVGVSPNISKAYYEKKWNEGDSGAPDCYSVNGVHPVAASPKKQCDSCAACPQNVWGSRVTDQGKKAKNCQDSRRIAVVPAADIANTDFGGPMLLSLPPMSLSGLSMFAKELGRLGGQPFMVATQLTFAPELAYPQIEFKALRWVTDEEAVTVKELLDDPQIGRMLTEEIETAEKPAQTEATSGLAGGPPTAFDAAEKRRAEEMEAHAKAQAERDEKIAAAKVAQDAEIEAQRVRDEQAAAIKTAEAKGLGGSVQKKSSPFGQAAAVTNGQAAVAGLKVEPEPTREVVQQAPADLEAQIDALLNG